MTYLKHLQLCLLFLFFTLASTVSGQDAFWGVRGGANFNKVDGIGISNSMYVGYTGGLFATFIISDRFSFQHELSYSVRGLNGKLANGDPNKVKLAYIDVPWMLNYNFSQALFVQAGVQASVYSFFKAPHNDTIPYNKYNANVFDFSVLLGAGVILDNNMIFGVRINQSLSHTFALNNTGGRILNLQAYMAYAINRNVKHGRKRSFGGGGGGYR